MVVGKKETKAFHQTEEKSSLLPLLELLAWIHWPKNLQHKSRGTKANNRSPAGTFNLTSEHPPGSTTQHVRMESI